MAEIGRFSNLEVVKEVDFGIYLDAGHLGTVLLPKRYVPENTVIGEYITVFLYLDSEDKPIATTLRPRAYVGQCVRLECVDVNDAGAFLDWGLPKDVLAPYNEQHKPFEVGNSYVVFLYKDEYTDRIVASSKLNLHLKEESEDFKPQDEVSLLICGKSDMGYKAVINHTHLGLIFRDDAFKPLKYGEKTTGYIKAIRADEKIDLSLQPEAGAGRDELSLQILAHLEDSGGSSTLTDKADPADIYKIFNVSKKNYKKALGALYKEKKIIIEKEKISLIN